MANKTFTTSPLLGINFDEKRSTVDGPAVRVGTFVPLISDNPDLLGRYALYVQANGIVGNSSYTTVAFTSVSLLASSVDGSGLGTSGYFRNGSVAFAASEYGWVYTINTALAKSLP